MFLIDTSEVRRAAIAQRAAGKLVSSKVSGRLTARANRIAAEARAAAPKDRPWLSTEQGIQVTTPRPMERRIFSGRDPDGQYSGYRVEFGTSKMPPRPFLIPAYRRNRDQFNREALDIAVDVLR